MKIKPQYDWILVKVTKVKAFGVIELAESAQKEEEVVEVEAIGPDVTRVKKGDRVVAIPLTGQGIPINGKTHVFIKEENIITIVEDE